MIPVSFLVPELVRHRAGKDCIEITKYLLFANIM